MARSAASALSPRPSVLHRRTSSRRRRDCVRTGSWRPGGRRTPRRLGTRAGRRGRPRCRRPGSRRCCSPSHLGPWVQASFLNTGAGGHAECLTRRQRAVRCFRPRPIRNLGCTRSPRHARRDRGRHRRSLCKRCRRAHV